MASDKLTDDFLLMERPHKSAYVGGVQRIYRFANGMGLSAVDSPMLHSYPFAWEIAVIRGVDDDGNFDSLDYSSGLTEDVEVFSTIEDANAFIARAASMFEPVS